MPGHGERFIETFDDWFTRINKRVQRLERRLAALPGAGPGTPTLLTNNSGFTGSVWAMKVASALVCHSISSRRIRVSIRIEAWMTWTIWTSREIRRLRTFLSDQP